MKGENMRNLLVIFFFIFAVSCIKPENAPSGLLVELLSHPEMSVITDKTPEFGWIVNSGIPGDYQTAYQIVVVSSGKISDADKEVIWNSGKIFSDQSNNVEYKGKTLLPQKSYWWKVRTWGKTEKPSSWSEIQRFNTSDFIENKKWPGESKWVGEIQELSLNEFSGAFSTISGADICFYLAPSNCNSKEATEGKKLCQAKGKALANLSNIVSNHLDLKT